MSTEGLLNAVREQEELIERAGDMQYAALHARLAEDTAKARELGLPEQWITQARETYHQQYADELESILERRKGNVRLQLWRQFKTQILNDHPLCARCSSKGKLSFTTEVRHLVVHGGNAELMFDPRLVEAVCTSHAHGRTWRPNTDGVST